MTDEQYIVSARKYRPATFKSVVGQKTLTETLKSAIAQKRLAQAYLFCGPRGVGKTSCARIFAKTINCLNPTSEGEACGECESCRAIQEGNSYNLIELDAASNNSVDDIRSLQDQVGTPPAIGKYRVFIIDEVHMLSSQAFNAFLKTLEEPPSYVIFILATTEKHKVIPTILSRCQIYDFKRITIQDTVDHLKYVADQEGISTDVAALNVIAKKADGAMRDALSIFDQVAASSLGNITYQSTIESLNVLDYDYYFRLVEAFRTGDVPQALMIYKDIRDRGFDSLFFINGLSNHIRDLMVAFSPRTQDLLEVADDLAEQYRSQARSLPVDWHYAAMRLLSECDITYRTTSNKQFLVELTLIRLCQLLNPPTPPFDKVDNAKIPLRDPVVPPENIKGAAPDYDSSVKSETAAPSVATDVQQNQHSEPTASVYSQSSSDRNPNDVSVKGDTQINSGHKDTSPSGDSTAPVTRTQRIRRQKVKVLTEEENESSAGQFAKLHSDVTLDAFMRQWQVYISENSDKQILTSAMRNCSPKQESADKFVITLEHQAQVTAFQSVINNLMTFLRSTLRNDFLTLEIKIDDGEKNLRHVPPQQLLREISIENPALSSLLEDIDAELT